MIVDVTNKKIFLKSAGVDLSPRVVNKRKIDKGNGQRFSQENRFEDILTVEISCFVDQKSVPFHSVSVQCRGREVSVPAPADVN